jgi:hypothetical protein
VTLLLSRPLPTMLSLTWMSTSPLLTIAAPPLRPMPVAESAAIVP